MVLERSGDPLSLDQWASWFSYNSNAYPITGVNTWYGDNKQEEPDPSFVGYVQQAYKANGVVFACELVRLSLFSQARFQFRRLRNGRPGDLFGNQDLQILEKPWRNGTTGDLLARMEQDASFAGNFYATTRPSGIKRMRPDWVTIVLGSDTNPDVAGDDLDAEIVGYLYHPGGRMSGEDPVPLLPEVVCHYAPIPDPIACYRGMSWLTPVIREVMADQAMTSHRQTFFEHAATPNLAIKLNPDLQVEAAKRWMEMFREQHEGVANAYKTMFLGGGADVTVVGANLEQIDFKKVQGAGETRIAADAGVPPVIVGLSEGLDAATYSNYSQARRRLVDGTMVWLWQNASASLAPLVTVPSDAELWYDDRHIPFLREDEKDRAEIQQAQSSAMKTLIDAGWDADTARDAILNDDFSRLAHTGLFSVQLQPAGSQPPLNGNGNKPAMRALAEALTDLARDD